MDGRRDGGMEGWRDGRKKLMDVIVKREIIGKQAKINEYYAIVYFHYFHYHYYYCHYFFLLIDFMWIYDTFWSVHYILNFFLFFNLFLTVYIFFLFLFDFFFINLRSIY